MKKMTIYRCKICGNVFCVAEDFKLIPECCMNPMEKFHEDIRNTVLNEYVSVLFDTEKNLRDAVGESESDRNGDDIGWIVLFTDKKCYGRKLNSKDLPATAFRVMPGEVLISAYGFSDVKGLWRK